MTDKSLPQGHALLTNVRDLLTQSRQQVVTVVNSAMVQTYWEIGRLIVEEEQQGEVRAEYGKQLLKQLSLSLTQEFGKGFDLTNLSKMRALFRCFPIRDSLRLELSWTHYRILTRLDNEQATLNEGDLLLFDNERVMHGREVQAVGARHLQGCYADKDSLLSTTAILKAIPPN